jgi:phage terminase small subunit
MTVMLTFKQSRFVEEFLIDLNARRAATRSGYSERSAEAQASRLLRNAKVDAAVREAMEARSRRTGVTADRVLCELAELAFSNIFDFIEVHPDGSVSVDLSRGTRGQAAAIRNVVVKRYAKGSGEEAPSAKLTRIEMCDKLKALELLAWHLGMLPFAGRRAHS